MRLSDAGVQFLKHEEGLVLKRYKDSAGNWTIGIGHLIQPDENYTVISEDQAIEIFKEDVKETEDAINDSVLVELEQHEFDALVSFVFNVGVGAFSGSTLLKKINLDRKEDATKEFKRWVYTTVNGKKVKDKVLIARRGREADLWQGKN